MLQSILPWMSFLYLRSAWFIGKIKSSQNRSYLRVYVEIFYTLIYFFNINIIDLNFRSSFRYDVRFVYSSFDPIQFNFLKISVSELFIQRFFKESFYLIINSSIKFHIQSFMHTPLYLHCITWDVSQCKTIGPTRCLV